MSIEIHVFSDRRLPSVADWQQAIVAEGFDLRLATGHPLEEQAGFLPAQLGERATGFECYHDDVGELIELYEGFAIGNSWKHVLSFRWGGDLAEGLAAYMAAAAYAKATGGVLFDPEEGQIVSPQRALETIREMERYLPVIEAERARARSAPDEAGS